MTLAIHMEPMTVAIQLSLLAQWIPPHPAVKPPPPPPDLQQHQKVNNSGVPVPEYVGVSPVPPHFLENRWVFLRQSLKYIQSDGS